MRFSQGKIIAVKINQRAHHWITSFKHCCKEESSAKALRSLIKMTYACVAEWKSTQVVKIPKNTISNTGTLNPFTPKI